MADQVAEEVAVGQLGQHFSVELEVEAEWVDGVLGLPDLQELVFVEAAELELHAVVEIVQAGGVGVEEEGFSAVGLPAVAGYLLAGEAVLLVADRADADLVADLAGLGALVPQLEEEVEGLRRRPELQEGNSEWSLKLPHVFKVLGECSKTLGIVKLA